MDSEPEIPFEALEPYSPQAELGGRTCKEPMSFAEALGDIFPPGIEDPAKGKHPFGGRCKVCDCLLPDPLWRQIAGSRGWYPINCCEACYANSQGDTETRRKQNEQWQRICPPAFRSDWDSRKGNEALIRRVRSYDHKTGRGLVIHGKSGTCKTRAAWHLTRQLMELGVGVTFVESIDMPDENMRDMMHAPVLVIDDLGNDKMNASREAVVLKVLRYRSNWGKPTIITTQFIGASLEDRFSDGHTAQAVIRRLREYCDDVAA